jgi:parallel beta-helix repeat protein
MQSSIARVLAPLSLSILFLATPLLTSAATNCAPAPTSSIVVNVKNTGAKGDGVTDDTAAIQAAIDQVTGTGGTVYVPDGTYMIDAVTMLFVKSNMTFSMSSGAILKAIPNGANDFNIIRINFASNVNVVGGTLQGERYQHLVTSGEFGMGLGIYGSSNVFIDGVTSKDNWGDGFYLGTNSPSGITFCNVTADNNRRQGMSVITANGMVIKNSTFKNTNGTAPASGIDIEPETGNTVNNVQILNNQFLNNDESGVLLTYNPAYNGLTFITNIKIDGNTITGNDRHFYDVNTEGGIVLLNVTGVQVTNNTITNDVKDGIHLGQPGTGTVAKNNAITGNTISNNQRYGIILESGSTANTITNNTVCNNASGQIIDNVGGNTISGNTTTCGNIPTATLSANPANIASGQSSTLTWSSTNATSCTGTGFTASGTSGTATVSPTATQTYSITCTGTSGNATASATVSVVSVSQNGATATPGTGTLTDSALNTWAITTGGVITENGVISAGTANVILILWYNNAIYQKNSAGGWWQWLGTAWSAPLSGDPRGTSPTVTLTTNPTSITSGQSSTLTWSSTNATSCTGTGFTASGTSGTATVSPTATQTYSISCTGSGGSTSASATVTVSAPESAEATTITTVGPALTDSHGNTWTLTNTGNPFQIAVNGVMDTPTGYVTQLVYHNHQVWQENSFLNWYYKGQPSDAWTVNGTVGPFPTDTTPPSVPTNLAGSAISSSQINLTWTASTDNVGVTGYKIFRSGTQIGTSATNSFSNTGLTASTAYTYTVSAYDAAGNNSAPSTAMSVITLGSGTATITISSRVTTTANLNVRTSASPNAPKVGTEAVGSLGTVVGGPTNASGHTWWQINYDNGITGWSIGDYLKAVTTASSPAVGMIIQPSSSSLIAQLMQQVQSLLSQIQTLRSQTAAVGARGN